MKITSIELEKRRLPLNKVFRTSVRQTMHILEINIAIKTQSGLCGRGAACAIPKVTGEVLDGIQQTISEEIFPAIHGMSLEESERILERVANAIVYNPAAKAAVDMAIYQLLAKRAGVSLWQLLGGYRKKMTTNLTLSLDSPEKMAAEAQDALQKGFYHLKLKVGTNPNDDLARVAAVRQEVGESVKLRLDANQAWKPREAVKLIRRLEKYRPELIEQPVSAWDIEGLARVRNLVDTPIMADESLFSAQDAMRLISAQAVDLFNIKLLKCGGIYQALKIIAIAQEQGIECMLGCMMEGSTSLLAAIHLAMAKKAITRIDLDSLFFMDAKNVDLPGITYAPQIEIYGKGKEQA